MSLLISWVTLTVSLFAASKLLKGFTIKGGVGSHLGVAALYGLMLFAFGWCIHGLLILLSAGLALLPLLSFVAQLMVGAILLLVTDKMSKRLTIDGFGTAFMAALIGALTSNAAVWAYENLLGR
ncbi:MAG: phage holin family protein [Polyangiales bacterium]